ncbi:MAG: phasin family protein [Candidatus Omnitrophica bacterium]|nr:phasin family protein [Candidatus Omnitrophota bacterium]
MSILKDLVNLGLGALVITKEKAEEVVNELVKKGEVGQDEGKELINELIEKGEKSKKEIEEQIEKMVKGVLEKLDISAKKEIKELKSEIEELKKKLNKEE